MLLKTKKTGLHSTRLLNLDSEEFEFTKENFIKSNDNDTVLISLSLIEETEGDAMNYTGGITVQSESNSTNKYSK